jgi:glucan-binding YG repeat protein
LGGITIRRLKIIENNFTKNYRLNKKKSNQLLLTTKIVLFASSIALINPVKVTASSNTIIENQDSEKINDIEDEITNTKEESNNDKGKEYIFYVSLTSLLFSLSLIGSDLCIKLVTNIKSNPYVPKTGIKLEEDDTEYFENKRLKKSSSIVIK